jgi:hypothetical protein
LERDFRQEKETRLSPGKRNDNSVGVFTSITDVCLLPQTDAIFVRAFTIAALIRHGNGTTRQKPGRIPGLRHFG